MELNRNHFFMAGIIILLLGLQLRAVDTFTLNKEASQFLATRFPSKSEGPVATTLTQWSVGASPPPLRTIRPPRWLGYALISVGAVLILQSLAMPKPS